VLITIACPFCEWRFQVDSSLRGRQMRCPNADCREVFEVKELPPAPEAVIEGVPVPSAPPAQQAGRVEDMVPILGAEVAAPPPAPSPAPAEPDWRTAPPPPVRARGATPPPEPVAKPVAPPPAAEEPPRRKARGEKPSRGADEANGGRRRSSRGPTVKAPGSWEPPPVRRGDSITTAPPARRPTALDGEAVARARSRRNQWFMLAVIGLASCLLIGGGGLALFFLRDSEYRDRAAAEKMYADGQFGQAGAQYGKLVEKYPDSPRLDDYRFLQDLCAVLALPHALERQGAFDRVSTFLKERKDDPRLAERGKEVGDALVKLLEDAGKAARENLRDAAAQADFQRGQEVLGELLALTPDSKGWVPEDKVNEVRLVRAEIDKLLDMERQRLALLAQLRQLAERPDAEAVRRWRELLRAALARLPGIDQDPEVKKAENELYEKHRDSVAFTAKEEVPPGEYVVEDRERGLLVQPSVAASGDGPPLAPDGVYFALARGVLYALRQDNGDILWARRVGVDTAQLPVRVPRVGNTPEMALVLSADTLTLTAVNPRTGGMLWQHHLGAASLGRPVVVDRRAYVATHDGEVREIELAGGELLGRYKLGQSLSVGGARLGESKFLFFPGDDACVYVLDVENRRCQAVLYTEHAAGALRGEPILLPSEDDPNAPGYLVLSQVHGLDATLLRTFRLVPPNPVAPPGAREARLQAEPVNMPERRLRGWPWFPPYHDPEKLITVTDAGMLGLFGIVQAHNKDDPLFPLVRVPDAEEGTIELMPGSGAARGRAQVVHAEGDDLWVLARGRLMRYLLTINDAGPRAVPYKSWGGGLELGSPLHASQTDDAGRTLFLVTQSPNGQTCLTTAVDARTGRVRWQRQLGLVCNGDPQRLGGEVVALDQGGGLFLFDAGKLPQDAEEQWQTGGFGLADPLPQGVGGSVYLVRGPDGQSVYEFACPDPGSRLIVRQYSSGRAKASEQIIPLPARLAGTPAMGEKRLLLPLANGDTWQVRLPLGAGDAVGLQGPTWRASRIDVQAQGHVVWLGGDEFLTTNGQNGLTRWRFPKGDIYEGVPDGKDARKPTLALPERVARAPAVLSRAGDGTTLRVCVADDRGTVYLFEGDAVKPVRQWPLKGTITAGPFVRDGRVACVVDRRRLVWLDPAKDGVLWEYESPGEGIVGQPQLAEGLVLVADVSGRFVGLDPATGQVRGPGYALKASVAPAATPVGFGPGHAFAPLTDGTVLLLPLHHLREPLSGLPPVW
jgi:outer membrane protein assembly factor BamB